MKACYSFVSIIACLDLSEFGNGCMILNHPMVHLRTFALIVFVYPYCACKFMSQSAMSFIERTHGGRFVGNCALLAKTTTSPGFFGLKGSVTPTFFGQIAVFCKFLAIVKIWTKDQCWKVIFSPFSTPAIEFRTL